MYKSDNEELKAILAEFMKIHVDLLIDSTQHQAAFNKITGLSEAYRTLKDAGCSTRKIIDTLFPSRKIEREKKIEEELKKN